jgi:hypothetical protein
LTCVFWAENSKSILPAMDSKGSSGIGVCTGVTAPIVAIVAYLLDVASGMADAESRLQDQNDFWVSSLDERIPRPPATLSAFRNGAADGVVFEDGVFHEGLYVRVKAVPRLSRGDRREQRSGFLHFAARNCASSFGRNDNSLVGEKRTGDRQKQKRNAGVLRFARNDRVKVNGQGR